MSRVNTWTTTATDSLKCRVSAQEVTAIDLQVPEGGPLITVGREQLITNLFQPDMVRFSVGIHRALLGEALLLDGQNVPAIVAFAQTPRAVPQLIRTVQNLQDLAMDRGAV